MPATIRIYDDTAGEFKYSGNWFRAGTWSSGDGQSGTLASTNVEGASVSFTFPVAATGFRFYGMKRSRGGAYGICVDCNPNAPLYTFVDAFDASDNGASPPTSLYHHWWLAPGVHTVTIINQADRRGTPAGNSQLTLDRFELDVPVAAQSTVIIQRPPNTVVSTVVQTQVQQSTVIAGDGGGAGAGNGPVTTQVLNQGTGVVTVVVTQNVTAGGGASTPAATGASSPITAAASASVPNSQIQTGLTSPSPSTAPSNDTLGTFVNDATSSSKSTPLGGIIGGVVGGLAIIAMAILLFFWLKKGRTSAATGPTPLQAPEIRTTSSGATTTTPSASPRGGWVTGYGFGANEKGNRHRPDQSYSSHPSNNMTSNVALLSSSPVPPPASTSSSSQSQSHSHTLSNEYSNSGAPETQRVRELDAGPVPRHLRYEDDTETLPPEYGQLFSSRLSGRASQVGQQPPRSPPPPLPTPLGPESPLLTGGLSSSGATAATFTTAATTSFALSPSRSSQPLQPVRRT